MNELRWIADPDPVDERDQIAWAGKCPIGSVNLSGSGRWRWEIIALPGLWSHRDERRGWCADEDVAKEMVAIRWRQWLNAAGIHVLEIGE